jgi:aquaporin Z
VILLVTGKAAAPGFAGLAIGLTLAAVHLIGIPLTGTSVNPARSLGPALFAGGDPLAHVWVFLVAPMAGAVLAVLVVRALSVPTLTVDQSGPAVALDETGAQLPNEESPGTADRQLPRARTAVEGDAARRTPH